MRHCTIAATLTCALLVVTPMPGGAATLPSPPLTFIDTTFSPPSGNTITVNSGGNLQAALNNAQLGDTIVLQAGATFTGPFTLPNKTTGNGWIYVQSSALASLPAPGTRVTPANAVNMPKITVPDFAGSAVQTSSGAHHFRFVGIEFKPVAGKFVFSLIDIGGATSVLANMPTDITIDRCYVHGDPTVGGRRGVAMNGARVAVIDSYVSDFKEVGADTQALWTYNSPGPLKIVNNYLEASGENFLSGGAEPVITNLVPSDIEIRRNHFFKPLAWISQSWSVKNLLELKNAERVLIEGNILENNWLASQNGFALLITPRNENGTAPWSATRDITVRYNKLINVGQGFNISGRDTNFGGNASQETHRVLIEHNVIEVTRLQGADGRIFGIVNGPVDLTIRHNTGIIRASEGTSAFVQNAPKANIFDFRDNLLTHGLYGFIGAGVGPGTPTLEAYFANYTFLKNALIGPFVGGQGGYPAGNFFPADPAVVGFVDYGNRNYRLSPTSPYVGAGSDGKDVGANISAIEAAIAGISIPTLPVTVSVAKIGNGTGSVTSLPAGVSCGSLCTVNFESGSYIALSAIPAAGSVFTGWSGACVGTGTCYVTVSQPTNVTATFDVPSTSTPRLTNISTRMPVLTGNNVMIGGFILGSGGSTKNVVLRARGPTLAAQGVTGVLANPLLQLYSGSTPLAANDDWQVGPSAGAVGSSGFAPTNPQEAAIYRGLAPGAYTALVSGVGGTTGVGIVEVFEVDGPGVPLTNISTRGMVGTGNNALIAGFVVSGTSPLTVVIRARGPSLTQSGLTGVLGNPVLQLFAGSTSLAINDDWQAAPNAAAIQLSGLAPSNPLESALLVTLNPGAYTAVLSGTGTSTGLAIVEVFAQ